MRTRPSLSATMCVCRAGRDVRIGKFLVPRRFARIARFRRPAPRTPSSRRAANRRRRLSASRRRGERCSRICAAITFGHLARARIERRDHARDQQRTDARRNRNAVRWLRPSMWMLLRALMSAAFLPRGGPFFELGHAFLRQREQADRRLARRNAFEREPFALFLNRAHPSRHPRPARSESPPRLRRRRRSRRPARRTRRRT